MDFDAGVKLQKEVLNELLEEGDKTVPTQWIETDKKSTFKETWNGALT